MPIAPSNPDRIVAILDPESGSSDEGFRQRVERALTTKGEPFEIRETTQDRDGGVLTREAREEGVRYAMACGGDGTLTAVLNGLGPNEEDENTVTPVQAGRRR